MKLLQLLDGVNYKVVKGTLDKEIVNIQYDSRKVTNNDIFVCLSGFEVDGHNFANKAIENGARVIICEKDIELVNESNDIVIFENGIKEPIEYSLSEISYIFEDDIEGFNNCGSNFNEGIELALREARLEYDKLNKEEFSNYIGRFIYAQFRCEEIYNSLLELESITRSL